MSDEIRTFVVGQLDTNCYAYLSEGEALVIDPGASGARIGSALADVRVVGIVATHCHHDHVCGIAALREVTTAPWYICAADADAACQALERSIHATPESVAAGALANPPVPDAVLAEGDVLAVGTARFSVVETPGHTPGGIILVGGGTAKGIAFMGDTLFASSCGRTDLAGGNPAEMRATLNRLRDVIDPATTLLCGHGRATTMGEELATNPWLQELV